MDVLLSIIGVCVAAAVLYSIHPAFRSRSLFLSGPFCRDADGSISRKSTILVFAGVALPVVLLFVLQTHVCERMVPGATFSLFGCILPVGALLIVLAYLAVLAVLRIVDIEFACRSFIPMAAALFAGVMAAGTTLWTLGMP